MFKLFQAALVFVAMSGAAAHASVTVSFIEGAPKDRFVITNSGECSYQKIALKIDLQETAGRLIFDTTANGAGVEVFQPFDAGDGPISLVNATDVKDGQQSLDLLIDVLKPNQSVGFTIDVDDTLTQSELGNIRVSRAEIEGGVVIIGLTDVDSFQASFNSDAKADVELPSSC